MTIQSPTAKDADTLNAHPEGVVTEQRVTSLLTSIRSWTLSLLQRSPGVVASGAIAVLFAVGYLLAPPMGRDFSAQVAHAQLAETHWPELLDLRWYGGITPLGYSVLSPPLMALLGVPLTTALGYVASVVLFAALLKSTAVPRPVAGAIIGAICLTGNLVTTRTTFALGLALGLGVLLALISGRLRITSLLAVVTALTSSVAGLFLAIAAGALLLSGRRRGGVTLAVSALVPTVVVGLAFGNGGRQPFADEHALRALVICLAVVALCWRTAVVRWGALLSAGLVAAAYVLPTPVGTNATRLPELFAAPTIVALATLPLVALIAATLSAIVVLPPVALTEVRERGDPALTPAFYAPLLDQLTARGVDGPIEVIPTQRRGEAAAVPPVVPIARGWLRQVDIERNSIFYNGTLNPDTYRAWLAENAISFVAVSDGPYDWSAPDEAALVRGGLPYLQAVWWNQNWTLYAVANPRPVISYPGRVITRDPVSITVSLPQSGEYVLRVRWSRYLSASEGCIRPTADGWSAVVVGRSDTVKIEGSLTPRHC